MKPNNRGGVGLENSKEVRYAEKAAERLTDRGSRSLTYHIDGQRAATHRAVTDLEDSGKDVAPVDRWVNIDAEQLPSLEEGLSLLGSEKRFAATMLKQLREIQRQRSQVQPIPLDRIS